MADEDGILSFCGMQALVVRTWLDSSSDVFVRTLDSGLEDWGQRVAYWMHRDHPGDDTIVDLSKLLRVPVCEVNHVFEVKRPDQLRGVSAMASVLARLRAIGDYDNAVLERQKLANLFAAFITRGVGSDMDLDPLTNMPLGMVFKTLPLSQPEGLRIV